MPAQSRLTGAIALVIAQGVVLVLGFAAHFWIGRKLGPGSYGVYGVVLSVQTIVGLLLTFGVPMAISRFVAQDPNHARSIVRQGLYWQLLIAIGIAAITFVVSPLLAHVLNDASLTNLIRFSSLMILAQSGYPVFAQFLSGIHRFNRQAALTVFYASAKLVAAIALLSTFAVYGALAGFGIGGLCAAALGWYWMQGHGTKGTHRLRLTTFFSFAGLYVLILFGLQILISLDLFMVKAILHDDVQAGYYNVASTLARISYLLLQGVAFILLPSVSALTKPGQSHDKAIHFIQDTLRYLIALIIPSIALAAATSQDLITLAFSQKYLPAAPALTILMIGVGSIAFYLLLANIVAGAGKAKVGMWITIGMLAISAFLGRLLIPNYGLLGAAWQTTIAGLIGLATLGIYTFKTFGIPVPWLSTSRIIVASAAATSITYLWHGSALLLPLLYVFCLVVYVAMLIILKEVSTHDRQLIASLHPRLRWVASSRR